MTILKDVLAELIAMFLGDARLAIAILTLVAAVAILINLAKVDALFGGAALLAGCLAILMVVTTAEARKGGAK